MAKFKVRDEEKPVTEPVTELWLGRSVEGIHLMVAQEGSASSNFLLSVKKNGKVYLHSGISEGLGFELDAKGRVILDVSGS